jgi:hypothetical protein
MKLTENGNFGLFAVNGKWKWQTFVCLLQTEAEDFFLGQQTINGN